jgi:hypothetical protein
MMRAACRTSALLLVTLLGLAAFSPVIAAPHRAPSKPPKKTETGDKEKAKPVQVGTFGDWGAFVADSAKEKTCYALAQPKDREPAKLKRDPAYVFISTRPSENIRNEVSVIMGFEMKDGGEAVAEIGSDSFDLVSKGKNAWVKNVAKESELIAAMKHGHELVVKAASIKGKMTTDTYSLSGLTQALERIKKECR